MCAVVISLQFRLDGAYKISQSTGGVSCIRLGVFVCWFVWMCTSVSLGGKGVDGGFFSVVWEWFCCMVECVSFIYIIYNIMYCISIVFNLGINYILAFMFLLVSYFVGIFVCVCVYVGALCYIGLIPNAILSAHCLVVLVWIRVVCEGVCDPQIFERNSLKIAKKETILCKAVWFSSEINKWFVEIKNIIQHLHKPYWSTFTYRVIRCPCLYM